jgi:hypothetical protein
VRYVRVPKEISSKDIRSEGFCYSPGRFIRFVPPELGVSSHFAPLDKLVVVRDEAVKVAKGGSYRYAEIGDIDVDTGGVVFQQSLGYRLPNQRPQRVRHGDVLISTVRTYRKGIGVVTDPDGQDLVATKAILALSSVTDHAPGVSLPYVFSFLRTDFFVEQVWSLLHRGVYPRMDRGALRRILIPIATDPRVCKYVAVLSEAIAEKELAIRTRHKTILQSIDAELGQSCQGAEFVYSHPTLAEVSATMRLDTGLYCRGFRAFKHRVDSYRHGATTLSKMGVRSRRGPNLAVSVIGRSLYSEDYKAGWYELIRPVNISEYGTLARREWLGNRHNLSTVTRGDLILGCEGYEKGRSIVLIDEPERMTTNFHGTAISWPGADLHQVVWLRCYFAFLRDQGVIDWVGVGGSGGHMSPEYFDYLPIPCFPDDVQESIARLYHSPASDEGQPPGLTAFVEYHRARNAGLGIWQLAGELKALQAALSIVQESIIRGESVVVPLTG